MKQLILHKLISCQLCVFDQFPAEPVEKSVGIRKSLSGNMLRQVVNFVREMSWNYGRTHVEAFFSSKPTAWMHGGSEPHAHEDHTNRNFACWRWSRNLLLIIVQKPNKCAPARAVRKEAKAMWPGRVSRPRRCILSRRVADRRSAG